MVISRGVIYEEIILHWSSEVGAHEGYGNEI
jgi:hypothetical protein